MARNMSAKTKSNSGNDITHTWGLIGKDYAISSGGWVTGCHNYAKRSMGYMGGNIGCWICAMHNLG